MTGDIQFEKAEFASGEHCVDCQNRLQNSYFQRNGSTICPGCAEKARLDHQLHESQGAGLGRAVLFGLGAAIAGAAIYGTIAVATGYEFGLIAILIGWLVGKAMMRGSRGIGGRKFQVAAVMITYLSITAGYVPSIIKELMKMEASKTESPADTPEAESKAVPSTDITSPDSSNEPLTASGVVLTFAFLFGIAAVAPFLNLTSGISGLIGLVILAVGLMQAWKETHRQSFSLSGPFPLKTQPEMNEAPS